jgi:hypothetical protein
MIPKAPIPLPDPAQLEQEFHAAHGERALLAMAFRCLQAAKAWKRYAEQSRKDAPK